MSGICSAHQHNEPGCSNCQVVLPTLTAIERAEWRIRANGAMTVNKSDLTELVRLSKLGERVERCEQKRDDDYDRSDNGPYETGWNDCLAWIKGES